MRLINADKLKDWLYNMFYYNDSINDRTYIRDHIDEMSTVDAEPVKHGHWIDKQYGVSFGDRHYPFWAFGKCSECGKVSADAGAYCTNCGAKMDGE